MAKKPRGKDKLSRNKTGLPEPEKHYGMSRSTKKAIAWTAGGGILLVILAIWITAAILHNSGEDSADGTTDEQTVQPNTDADVEEIQRTLTGNTIDEDRQAALDEATALLNEAYIPDSEEFVAAMESLDDEGMEADVATEELVAYMRFEDTFDATPLRQVNSIQTVLTLAEISAQVTGNDSGEITPVDDAWSMVHMDSATGTAYVPLDAYTGTATGYSLMMVYVDEQWQLDPYPLLDSVNLAAMIQNNETPEELENVPE